MSTRFAARKLQEESQEATVKVNWLYPADLETMMLSISENSGIVKVDLGLGRRNPSLYRNELLAILDKADEIRRYFEDHPQAKDTPPSRREQREMQAIVSTVVKAKEREAYKQALVDAGVEATQIEIALVKKFGA